MNNVIPVAIRNHMFEAAKYLKFRAGDLGGIFQNPVEITPKMADNALAALADFRKELDDFEHKFNDVIKPYASEGPEWVRIIHRPSPVEIRMTGVLSREEVKKWESNLSLSKNIIGKVGFEGFKEASDFTINQYDFAQ